MMSQIIAISKKKNVTSNLNIKFICILLSEVGDMVT